MDKTNPPFRGGLFMSLVSSIALPVLFFLPWLKLSCNPQAVAGAGGVRGLEELPKELTQRTVLARASGWDLARGELTPDGRFKRHACTAPQDQKGPPAKPWAYGGLVLPGLAGLLALLCLAGRITAPGAGRGLLPLGLAGVVLMALAASTDYVDEAMGQAQKEMSARGLPAACFAAEPGMAAAKEQFKRFVQTKTTPYLWASLALYVLIAGCGLIALGASPPVRAPLPSTSPSDSPDPGEASDVMWTGPARAAPAPGAMPDLGPALTPVEAPAPPADDEADSET